MPDRCDLTYEGGCHLQCKARGAQSVKLDVTLSVKPGGTLAVKPTQGLSMILTCYKIKYIQCI